MNERAALPPAVLKHLKRAAAAHARIAVTMTDVHERRRRLTVDESFGVLAWLAEADRALVAVAESLGRRRSKP